MDVERERGEGRSKVPTQARRRVAYCLRTLSRREEGEACISVVAAELKGGGGDNIAKLLEIVPLGGTVANAVMQNVF